jgi:hypothetical protein
MASTFDVALATGHDVYRLSIFTGDDALVWGSRHPPDPPRKAPAYVHHGRGFFLSAWRCRSARAQHLAAPRRRSVTCTTVRGSAVHVKPYHVAAFKPADADDPRGAADDHYENHLLTEENRRLKDELKRAESALRVAAKVLGPYLK